MKLTKFEFAPEDFIHKSIAQDLWEIEDEIKCELKLNHNESFIYSLKKGFRTNYRSGPKWIDSIAPKFGTPKIKISWMIHDANYEGYLSKKDADKLLYLMLMETELEKMNCEIIYIGLRIFGGFNYQSTKDNNHIEFEHKIMPRKTRSILEKTTDPEDLLTEINVIFEGTNREVINEELKKIAEKNNFGYNEEQLDVYYK